MSDSERPCADRLSLSPVGELSGTSSTGKPYREESNLSHPQESCPRPQTLATGSTSGKFVSHHEFAAQYGADPTHVDVIRQFAGENNLQMLERGDEVLGRTVTPAGITSIHGAVNLKNVL